MTPYQVNALRYLGPFELTIFGVALIYLIFLKAHVGKRLLLAAPSVIFFMLPLILIWITPDPMASVNRAPGSAFELFLFGSYIAAISLAIFNGFYVRTRLHWLQVINILSVAMTVMGWALLGD
jgi:energy-coupling factor transporter transmembrane protein EcfT